MILQHVLSKFGRKAIAYHWKNIPELSMVITWRHQATTWTNVGFSLESFRGIHLRAISQPVPNLLFYIMSLKIIFKITATSPSGQRVSRESESNQCRSDTYFTLTHWGRDKMAAVFQTTFSNALSLMKNACISINVSLIFFQWVQLIIF